MSEQARGKSEDRRAIARALRAQRRTRSYSFREARVLLAVASFDGNIRFLNCAWEAVLGPDAKPRCMRPLRDILAPDSETADIVAKALLDRRCRMPIEIGIRDASGKICRFLWHRRYDPNDQLMYLAGEEVTDSSAGSAGQGGRQAA